MAGRRTGEVCEIEQRGAVVAHCTAVATGTRVWTLCRRHPGPELDWRSDVPAPEGVQADELLASEVCWVVRAAEGESACGGRQASSRWRKTQQRSAIGSREWWECFTVEGEVRGVKGDPHGIGQNWTPRAYPGIRSPGSPGSKTPHHSRIRDAWSRENVKYMYAVTGCIRVMLYALIQSRLIPRLLIVCLPYRVMHRSLMVQR